MGPVTASILISGTIALGSDILTSFGMVKAVHWWEKRKKSPKSYEWKRR